MTDATPALNAKELEKTDVVIVGLGAAGGIASHMLANAGLKVVGLEAGPRLNRADFLANYDELEGTSFNNHTGEPKANHEVPTWRRTADSNIEKPAFAVRMANMVGGTSVHYAAQSWRFRKDDFTIRSSTIERYGEEALPEGSALQDWPVNYDDLEPYYEKVEALIGVSGVRGGNPFESPMASEYPLPPLQRAGYPEMGREAMERLGYNPFQGPMAILSEEYNGRQACTYCGYCTGFGCWNDSKSSTLVSAIPEAEATGNLEVRPNSRVFKVLVDDSGRASGVEYRGEDGQMYIQPASLVILSSYTFENVRLLLLSKSDQFPNGLANNNGQVGKYYFTHGLPGVNAFFEDKNLNRSSGAFGQNATIDDLNGDNFDHSDLGFIRGACIQATMGESHPIGSSGALPPGAPQWGREYKRFLKENGQAVAGISTLLEVLPYEDNFLDLDPEKTDPDGVPVIRITYDIKENEKRMWDHLLPRIEEILKEMGATEIWSHPIDTNPIMGHDMGGARAGDDPATSVVDRYLLTHEVPNLAIMGGAVLPSGGGFNPTETFQAWTWLACEYIAKNFTDIAN